MLKVDQGETDRVGGLDHICDHREMRFCLCRLDHLFELHLLVCTQHFSFGIVLPSGSIASKSYKYFLYIKHKTLRSESGQQH